MATVGTATFGLTATYAERLSAAQVLMDSGWTVDSAFVHVEGTCDRAYCCGWDGEPDCKRDDIRERIDAGLRERGTCLEYVEDGSCIHSAHTH